MINVKASINTGKSKFKTTISATNARQVIKDLATENLILSIDLKDAHDLIKEQLNHTPISMSEALDDCGIKPVVRIDGQLEFRNPIDSFIEATYYREVVENTSGLNDFILCWEKIEAIGFYNWIFETEGVLEGSMHHFLAWLLKNDIAHHYKHKIPKEVYPRLLETPDLLKDIPSHILKSYGLV